VLLPLPQMLYRWHSRLQGEQQQGNRGRGAKAAIRKAQMETVSGSAGVYSLDGTKECMWFGATARTQTRRTHTMLYQTCRTAEVKYISITLMPRYYAPWFCAAGTMRSPPVESGSLLAYAGGATASISCAYCS
jgi:hypothetical protein